MAVIRSVRSSYAHGLLHCVEQVLSNPRVFCFAVEPHRVVTLHNRRELLSCLAESNGVERVASLRGCLTSQVLKPVNVESDDSHAFVPGAHDFVVNPLSVRRA